MNSRCVATERLQIINTRPIEALKREMTSVALPQEIKAFYKASALIIFISSAPSGYAQKILRYYGIDSLPMVNNLSNISIVSHG